MAKVAITVNGSAPPNIYPPMILGSSAAASGDDVTIFCCPTGAPTMVKGELVRLFHVSLSRVECGLCANVCPVDIPLWAVAIKTAGSVQESFGYLPGRDLEEELPITSFKPEEFAAIVD